MKKLGIFPGSFNPFHFGHLDILEKAEALFDKVIVAVGTNLQKESKESKVDRVETIKRQFSGKNVEGFEGFLVDYVYQKEEEGWDVTIVRGLRNGYDLDYEINQLRVMQDQKGDIKMVFVPCDVKYEHISSSMIRTMEKVQEGSGNVYVPSLNKEDFAIRQIFEAFGKPKGHSFEDFYKEAESLLKDLREKEKKTKIFRECYNKKHVCCPKCGSKNHTTTLVGFPFVEGKESEYEDLNNCVCLQCGDKHIFHQRVEETNNNKNEKSLE